MLIPKAERLAQGVEVNPQIDWSKVILIIEVMDPANNVFTTRSREELTVDHIDAAIYHLEKCKAEKLGQKGS